MWANNHYRRVDQGVVLAAVKTLMTNILGQERERAVRVPDVTYYKQLYFDERLKVDSHARQALAMANWEANGSVPAAKPAWLKTVAAVAKEHWDREPADFRAELHTANELDYEARRAAAEEINEQAVLSKPTTPEDYEA